MKNKQTYEDSVIFKFICDNANDAYFLSGRDAMYYYVNESACRMMGYSKNELLNLGVPDADILYDISKYQEIFDLAQKETVPPFETINKRKDGTTFPSEITLTGYQIEGQPFMFAALRDITDRKRAEDELKFRSGITEQVSASVITTGLDFRINWANQAFSALYGYSSDEIIGQTPDFLNIDPLSEEIQRDVYQTVSSGEVWTGEVMNRRKDNTTFLCELNIFPLKDENGKIFAYVGNQQDITERKKAEVALLDVAKGISGKIGEGFFIELIEHLANILEADYAYIAELVPDKSNHAQTLSLIADGKFIENIEVNLVSTPCERVINKGISSFPANVQKLFPRAHTMSKMNVEGYIGIPLESSSGDCIGLMSVMYRQPIINASKIESLLKIFALRASSEIERKSIDEALAEAHNELEAKVERRTSELEESNTALKVLLKQRDHDKTHLEKNILTNIKQLILPYIDKIRNNHPDEETLTSLSILESNLKEIVSPFAKKLSSNYLGLTPKEINISNLIIVGKQDKEISTILNISPETVKSHRQNIRKKLGIYSKRANLRTYLLSLSD